MAASQTAAERIKHYQIIALEALLNPSYVMRKLSGLISYLCPSNGQSEPPCDRQRPMSSYVRQNYSEFGVSTKKIVFTV